MNFTLLTLHTKALTIVNLTKSTNKVISCAHCYVYKPLCINKYSPSGERNPCIRAGRVQEHGARSGAHLPRQEVRQPGAAAEAAERLHEQQEHPLRAKDAAVLLVDEAEEHDRRSLHN